MNTTEILIPLDTRLLAQIDQLIADQVYADRNHAIQTAVLDKLERLNRLARECAKLDPHEEQALAEEGLK
jgi:metal-responsive CopG/Arc/MetJ family transcriptional regulator